MTIPANLLLEAAPYGPMPVLPVTGPQGGPYDVAGPKAVTLLPSAPRTGTTSAPTQLGNTYKGMRINLKVTVNPGGAQTLSFQVGLYDVLTGDTTALLNVAASATPGGVWEIYPGLSGAVVGSLAGTVNAVLGAAWYAVVSHSGVGAWTYSLTADLIP